MKLVTPQINLNGNTAYSLVEQLVTIAEHLRKAEEAMTANNDCIHGRNFQTFDDATTRRQQAVEAWAERVATLHQIGREFTELAVAVQAQR